MYQNGAVSTERPATGDFTAEQRGALGVAITRARERIGLSQRALAQRARISRTPLWKLENGEPVTASMYEAVARVLPGWTEDTPRIILEGGPAPEIGATQAAADPRISPVLTSHPDDPAFWVALAREVSPDMFEELWKLYEDRRRMQRLLTERDRSHRPSDVDRSRSDDHSK